MALHHRFGLQPSTLPEKKKVRPGRTLHWCVRSYTAADGGGRSTFRLEAKERPALPGLNALRGLVVRWVRFVVALIWTLTETLICMILAGCN